MFINIVLFFFVNVISLVLLGLYYVIVGIGLLLEMYCNFILLLIWDDVNDVLMCVIIVGIVD